MRRRNPPMKALPSCWLVSDPERGGKLLSTMAVLPRGSGVIFRHYNVTDREDLARRAMRLARRRGLLFILAGDERLARRIGADGVHMPGFENVHRPLTAAAHDRVEIVRAARAGARAVFLSPVFATGSHPGALPLGRVRFGLLARHSPLPVIALGGMTRARYRSLVPLGARGWAAVSALSKSAGSGHSPRGTVC